MNNKEIKAIHTQTIINNLPRFFTRARYDFVRDTSAAFGYSLDSAIKNGLVYPCAFEMFDALDSDGYIIKRLRYYYTVAPAEKYLVITEILEGRDAGRWYYGEYLNRDQANRVAAYLGHDRVSGVYHSVIRASEAQAFGVQGLPEK